METKEKLQELAKELNEVLGLDPEISLELSEEKLLKEINEAKTMIEPGDTLTELAKEILAELDLPKAPEAENEKEDSIEAIPLRTQIENAERLKDLRDIAKANDEFKSIRGSLTKWKTKMSLIDVMLDVLDDMEGKEMQEKEEVKPEPKAKVKAKKVVAKEEEEKPEEKKTISKKEKLIKKEVLKSTSYYVRYFTCQNPEITVKEIEEKLKEIDLSQSLASITIRRAEMIHALNIMQELNKLK